MTKDTDYSAAWRDYRKRNYMMWGAFLGWPVFGVIVSISWELLFGKSNWIVVLFLPYMAFCAHCAIKLAIFTCPRCGNSFHGRGTGLFSFQNPYSKSCPNCGLPKYSVTDSGPDLAKIRSWSKFGRPLDILYWPLVVANVLVACLAGIGFLSSNDIDMHSGLFPLVMLVSMLSLIVALGGIFSIDEKNHLEVIKKVTPRQVYVLIAIGMVGGAVIGLLDLSTKPYFSPDGYFDVALIVRQFPPQSLVNISILYIARMVRKHSG